MDKGFKLHPLRLSLLVSRGGRCPAMLDRLEPESLKPPNQMIDRWQKPHVIHSCVTGARNQDSLSITRDNEGFQHQGASWFKQSLELLQVADWILPVIQHAHTQHGIETELAWVKRIEGQG